MLIARRRRRLRRHAALTACLAATLAVALGATAAAQAPPGVSVDACTESAFRAAVTTAEPGATITFSCDGTITLTAAGGDTPITIDKSLTIDGAGRAVTISGGDAVGLFFATNRATFTLRNLTLADGKGFGSDPEAQTNGGAVYSLTTLIVDNVDFVSNSTLGSGGAISSFGIAASLTVTDSSFSGNEGTCGFFCSTGLASSDGGGGAIGVASGGDTTITNTVFTANKMSGRGSGGAIGAIHTFNANADGPVTITGSTFTDNVVDPVSQGSGRRVGGGAVSAFNHDLTITGSTFDDNRVSPNGVQVAGGAVLIHGDDMEGGFALKQASITGSTFTGNAASGISSGGAIETVRVPTSVAGSSFSGNSASSGGAISGFSAPLDISGSLIQDNTATGTSGDPVAGGVSSFGGTVTFSDTDVFDNVSGNCGLRSGAQIVDGGLNAERPGASCGFNGVPRVEELNTSITQGPVFEFDSREVFFGYDSSRTSATFQCRVTAEGAVPGSFEPCPADGFRRELALGDYTFEVRAVDGAEVDPTPASRPFTVQDREVIEPAKVRIRLLRAEGKDVIARFSSSRNDADDRFQCRLVRIGEEEPTSDFSCEPGLSYRIPDPGPGRYEFKVLSISGSGDVDVTTRSVEVKAPRPPRVTIDRLKSEGDAVVGRFSVKSAPPGTSYACSLSPRRGGPSSQVDCRPGREVRFDGLQPGQYTFAVALSGESATLADRGVTVTAPEPSRAQIAHLRAKGDAVKARFSVHPPGPDGTTFECALVGSRGDEIARFSCEPDRTISVSDLEPGRYTFTVRGSDPGARKDSGSVTIEEPSRQS